MSTREDTDEMPSPTVALPPGIYDQLVSRAVACVLQGLGPQHEYKIAELDAAEAPSAIAQHVERLVASSLAQCRGEVAPDVRTRVLAALMQVLAENLGNEWLDRGLLAEPLQRLLAVAPEAVGGVGPRPDTPLGRSALLTGTRLDPSLAGQLRKEIATADRVDILCSFIRWSGLRLILDELKRLTEQPHQDGPRLRVITTSYMGATDPRAVEAIRDLPNTEIRVSYDTARTRLHAKAYLIHRVSGFGSAYIGSANLSHAALSEGLEWTSKISQYELPHLWGKILGTFETYWNDEEFEEFTHTTEERLRTAIRLERGTGGAGQIPFALLDLRPYPFQEEILDSLAAEREVQGKNNHLVVAATGTGKTMIAAFDYQRFSRPASKRPALLFVAHREEILRQALATYRAVLRDQNFGDLLVGGFEPDQTEHLFCSIQSYNSRELWRLTPAHFRYVVVDEFHHAAAASYRRLLDHVRPQVLLGLTATPERSDELDVLRWFGGEASAEIRLPDAINRRLLCPFQYFGVSDCVDLDGLRWQRGGYRVEDLDQVYTGNDVRARLVLDKVHEILLDPRQARGVGFCVSVAHAEFMSRFFNEHGLPSLALSADSVDDQRRSAQERLRRREINFIFVVDLYNEGVDIPELDTVLFLRPTESLTVYLQQLGRGLRLHDEKECLTVLDFIGAQHREFRFAPRLRAISTEPTGRLDREIESGFPHLPPGCSLQLERVAQERILHNVGQTLAARRSRLVGEIRELGRHYSRPPTIQETLAYLDTTLDDLLKRGLWSRLLAAAGWGDEVRDADEDQLAQGLRRLAHIDDPQQIRFLLGYLQAAGDLHPPDAQADRRLTMLHLTLWGTESVGWSLDEAGRRLRANPAALNDLWALLDHCLAHTRTRPQDLLPELAGPLALHAQYTRNEILAGLGHWTLERRPDVREGVLHLPTAQVDALFVTLHKTSEKYSPTTMYEDYAISTDLFHWQSQSTTSADSRTGQRYIHHRQQGYTPLLFVREHKEQAGGLAAPYAFLGPAEYVSHSGSRPISIVWRMRHPIPIRLLRPIARQAAG